MYVHYFLNHNYQRKFFTFRCFMCLPESAGGSSVDRDTSEKTINPDCSPHINSTYILSLYSGHFVLQHSLKVP